MPTHAGIFRQMLLGSTAAKVLNDADCPVLTSRHAEAINPRPLERREWVCAIGLSPNSERVLKTAHQGSLQARSKLSIIHVLRAGDSRQQANRRIADLQQIVGSDVLVRIAAGPVKDLLLEAARRSDADVFMIRRSPRPGAHGRMRDLTYATIRDSPFPVLSI